MIIKCNKEIYAFVLVPGVIQCSLTYFVVECFLTFTLFALHLVFVAFHGAEAVCCCVHATTIANSDSAALQTLAQKHI